MNEIDFKRFNKIARSLGIEVIKDSENSGIFHKNEKGELVEFDVREVLDVFYFYNKEKEKMELGYEVTPEQTLDGLWNTMLKYIEQHGYSDTSLELEGSYYEFRKHLEKYREYEVKAKALDSLKNNFEEEIKELTDRLSGFPYIDAPIKNTIGQIEYMIEIINKCENLTSTNG